MSGNGADVGAVLQAVLALGTELRAQGRRLDELDRKFDRVDRGLTEVRQDVAALRGEVAAYHGSVVGHGVLIGELEERVGRLERGEPPPKAA